MYRLAAFILAAFTAAILTIPLEAGFNPETGSYVFQVYSARTYGASAQNWGILQDSRGIMYFANTEGLLEFDGATWRVTRLPGANPTVRSIAMDRQGTVFVGGVGDFGMLRPDATGTRRFVSFLDRIPQSERVFADVWRVLDGPDGIYFSSYRRLFRLNRDGSVKVWTPDTRFGRAFVALGSVYVKTREQGLLRLSGDSFVAVPGGPAFANDDVSAILPLANSAVVATGAHLYRLTKAGAEQITTGADAFFAKSLIYSMLAISDGTTLVGTRSGGLAVVDLKNGGSVDRVITSENSVLGNFVTDLYPDRQGGVWVTGEHGIARFNPGLTSYPQADASTMTRHAGSVYVGTTTGLFRLQAAAGTSPLFQRVEGLNEGVSTLLSWQNSLLASADHGLFEIKGDKARRILETSGSLWDVTASLHDPHVVYAAGRNGVFLLRDNGRSWQNEGEFAPSGQEFRTVLEDDDGTVWATTRGGIWHIDFGKQPPAVTKFGPEQNVPANWVNARRLMGHIVFTTSTGLKRYSKSEGRIVPDHSLGTEFADGTRSIGNVFDDKSGNIWVTGPSYHGRLSPVSGGFRWDPMSLLRSGMREIFWMSIDDDGSCWARNDEKKLFRWDPSLNGHPEADFHILTRLILTNGTNTLFGGAGNPAAANLPFKSNALRFEFAAPFYEDPGSVQYQVKLDGNDSVWSAWSPETTKEYTHLSEGAYHFQIKAQSPHGALDQQSSVSFKILPPWYRTWWAYSVYMVFAGFGVWGIVRLRTRKLQAEKRRLETIVEERTVEIREQRDEIQVQERKSQSLLLNILPAKVADELKLTGSVQPVAFDEVTVCFTDFVGFTLSSENLAPGKLVDSLNEYFTAFDEIVARYSLEKLKTIGDSYMFASGLPVPRKSHAVDAVLAALEMVDAVERLARKPDGTAWGIRVGLHSGPVVAGVVGIRKFAFDIWGNTVNFAARMESSGVPGSVNMSERTCQLLCGLVVTEPRGNVKIKEGRELPMFLARGPLIASELEFGRRYGLQFGEKLKAFPVRQSGSAAGA